MCGRFVTTSSPDILVERFGVAESTVGARDPDYNVTPRAWVPVVRERPRDDPPTRVLSLIRWGLVPSWAESPAVGDRQINARAESITERNAYKRAFERRRCIVPADAFYEWKAPGQSLEGARAAPRVPYAVRRRDGEPLAFAGLWEIWRDPTVADDDDPDAWLRSFAIVTTRANARLAPIHERMPVVLAEEAWDAWLDPRRGGAESLPRLLAPAPDDWFDVYEVSTRVNKPENNDADLLRPVAA
ncbi:MAG TPA: SOS response-associated peptidase [Acidimicrobiia bacterium]|nr:SOS response-associated peptidase [Acidimicrobiia bacterium]